MLPKVIHYCWFGGKPLPKKAKKCIESWKKYLPDYEIKRWDETNFDVNISSYTQEAYSVGKYAFVSDYARFWIIYKYGGIYFDTDVEVVASMEEIIRKGSFLGVECQNADKITVNPGLGFGAVAGLEAIKDLLTQYEGLHFINTDGSISYKNIVEITSGYLLNHGMINTESCQNCAGFTIYPVDYFCPISFETRQLKITSNTRTIHHFAESWVPRSTRFKNALGRIMGPGFLQAMVKIKSILIRR
ncbi:MAG: glycosyl transferase [Bacteroidales bacterium]|nr:glycosyl transferase [Bacteroidales bacterium]